MKKGIKFLAIAMIGLAFTSCKKETIEPEKEIITYSVKCVRCYFKYENALYNRSNENPRTQYSFLEIYKGSNNMKFEVGNLKEIELELSQHQMLDLVQEVRLEVKKGKKVLLQEAFILGEYFNGKTFEGVTERKFTVKF